MRALLSVKRKSRQNGVTCVLETVILKTGAERDIEIYDSIGSIGSAWNGGLC